MDLAPGTVVADRFVVEARLGRGGMAVVYRVRHRALGTPFALKVLAIASPTAAERMADEGRHQARLRHPNVVAVQDLLTVNGAPALLLELVEGPPLSALVAAGPLRAEPLDGLGAGILAGVAAAHRLGIVHRDLKPGNVLLSVLDGRVVPKVSDFGTARVLDDDPATRRTATGASLGTPHYMAPEQVRDARDADARADVWALGVLLYELAAGTAPFDGPDRLELFQAIAHGEHRPLHERRPELPAPMLRAIEAALRVDRERRPADAGALLELWLGERRSADDDGGLAERVAAIRVPAEPPAAGSASTWGDGPPATAAGRAAVEKRPGIRRAAGIGLVLAVVLLAAIWWMRSEPPADVPPPETAPPTAHAVPMLDPLLDARFDDVVRLGEWSGARGARTAAVALYAFGRRRGAVETLEKARASADDADAASAMRVGLADPDVLEAWIERNPDDLLARAWRVVVAGAWDAEAVRDHAAAAARLAPGRALPCFLEARAARLAGRTEDAREALDRWERIVPGAVDWQLEWGRLYAATGRTDEARARFDVLSRQPTRSDIWAVRVGFDAAVPDPAAVERDRREAARLPLEGRLRFHLARADALLADHRSEAFQELDTADLACRGEDDAILQWFCVELAAETARLAFLAGERERVRAANGRLASYPGPEWAARGRTVRVTVSEGLLAVLEGRRAQALYWLDQLKRDGAPEVVVRPLVDALGSGPPPPLRVRAELLP